MTDPYYVNLAAIMNKTRGSRFNAASSLRIRERLSVATIAFLSVYVLAWAIFALGYPEVFDSNHARFYSAVSAIASVALLALSLMDFALGRGVKAERLEQNALEITVIMRALERELDLPTPGRKVLEGLARQYEELNAKTQTNHSESDHVRWVISRNRGNLGSVWSKSFLDFRLLVHDARTIAIAMSGHILLVVGILLSTAWYTAAFVFPS